MSNERRDEIEYASRVERAHRPLRQAREQFANELGDRRSLKIIRVVRPLTRSLRNCCAKYINKCTNEILPRGSSHESKTSMHVSNDKTSKRFRRAEGAINHFVLWPPLPQKNKLSSLEKFQSSSISSPPCH